MSPHFEASFDESHSQQDPVVGLNGTSSHVNGIGNGNGNATNGHISSPTPNGSSTSQPHRRTNQYSNRSKHLAPSPLDSEFDLICIGFGPASLAIAIALHDAIANRDASSSSTSSPAPPKVLFLEKQAAFAWHPGMLLPGAKMQISFVKDLATMRDPRSEFTFLNYLHRQGRLIDFTNLDTFLPARAEYEDYMRWCSSFFTDLVQYGRQVVSVSPEDVQQVASSGVRTFTVKASTVETGQLETYRGRNVLVAAGGQPSIPKSLPAGHARVIHSSQFAHRLPQILPKTATPCRVAVIGAGQSAAEIFNTVQKLYPNSETRLIMRQEFLRPSDDSPFVNSVFNPDYTDIMFPRAAHHRSNLLAEAKATNYGVVRLELIEQLYERMYEQRRDLGADERAWPHRILGARHITSVKANPRSDSLVITVQHVTDEVAVNEVSSGGIGEETFEADLIVAATGYQRTAHVEMLRDTWDMLPAKYATAAAAVSGLRQGIAGWDVETSGGERKMAVGRDYGVKFEPGQVEAGSGIWLQGCCEGTHGLSDTLLSVLATRSGEIVESIFGSGKAAV